MGAKPTLSRPRPRPRPLRSLAKLLLATAAAAAVSSCISDGPNRTGGEYLAQHGVLLQDPLYHVTLKNVPVDSFWTADGDANHIGDSILLAGRSGNFSAEARVAFNVSAASYLDSLDTDDATTLKLSLGVPPSGYAFEELKATLEGDDSGAAPDSVRFLVSAWDTTDEGLTDEDWNTLIDVWNRRYLIRNDTLAALPPASAIDTITLAARTAYSQNTPQANPLPALHKRFIDAKDHRHLVQMRLTPLFDSAADSGSAMLRLGGQLGNDGGLYYEPLLLFGRYDSSTAAPSANRLQPLITNSGLRGVDYTLRYAGPATDIVTGKRRGLHLILDRTLLLDSIDADLRRQGLPVETHPASGDFDLAYFVPFAKMTLPLAGTELEGGFPLEINLISSIDTLLDEESPGAVRVNVIPLDSGLDLWNTFESGDPGKVRNDVRLSYRSVTPALRRVELTFSRDSSRNDTLLIAAGETRQWSTGVSINGANSYLSLGLEAGEDSLTVRSFITAHGKTEPNEFRDPETGETITAMEQRIQRFLHPGQSDLTLRATNGIQSLLNRANSGNKILQDFQFQPALRPAIDSTVTVNGANVPYPVPYPVLSVVSPALDGGALKVDVELYLFPLKAR